MKALFFLEYLKHMRMVGAVAPSSRFLAQQMMAPIDFARAKTIVELGPGTGSFSRVVVARRQAGTKLLLIERNHAFYDELVQQFSGEPDIAIECGSAADLGVFLKKHHLPKRVDYVISGLPFAALPRSESNAILSEVTKHLHKDGAFVTFQYTRLMLPLFDQHFKTVALRREWRNIPPAYIVDCKL